MSWEELKADRGRRHREPGWYVSVNASGVRVVPPRDHRIFKSKRVRTFFGRGDDLGWMLIRPSGEVGRMINRSKAGQYIGFTTLPGITADYRLGPTRVTAEDEAEGGVRIRLPWYDQEAEAEITHGRVIHQDEGTVVIETAGGVVVGVDPAGHISESGVVTPEALSRLRETLPGRAPVEAKTAPAPAVPPPLPSHARSAAAFVKKQVRAQQSEDRRQQDAEQIEHFLTTQGASRTMSLEQAAEYLRQRGHRCVIEIGQPGKPNSHTVWKDPEIILDGAKVTIQAMFDVVNHHREQRELPPLALPTVHSEAVA